MISLTPSILHWLIQILPLAVLFVGGGFLLGLLLAMFAWSHLKRDLEAHVWKARDLEGRRSMLEETAITLEKEARDLIPKQTLSSDEPTKRGFLG